MLRAVPVQRFTDLEAHAKANGLSDEAAWRYAVLGWWTEHFGVPAPRIISGYRSPAYQRQLQERWDRGDRTGLASRPADNSQHSTRNAWDTEQTLGLAYMSALAPYLGVRWGGTFQDPDRNHFDLGIR